MPNRVVREEINASESLSLVSLGADLMFRALLVAVDDFGRIDARPAYLRSELFRFRTDVTVEHIVGWLAELSTVTVRPGDTPPVRLYECRHRPYLVLTGWERHRGNSHRAKYSKFPEPPEEPPRHPDSPEHSGKHRNAPEGSGSFPEIRPRDVVREARDVSREARSERRESRDGNGEPALSPEHPMVDPSRTDLDATLSPPERPGEGDQPESPPPDLTDEREVLDHWQGLALAASPGDARLQPEAWPALRDQHAGRLTPRLSAKGKPALLAAIDFGWADHGDGKRWSGWHSKMTSVEKLMLALTQSELVDQAESAGKAGQRSRASPGDVRRGVGYGGSAADFEELKRQRQQRRAS